MISHDDSAPGAAIAIEQQCYSAVGCIYKHADQYPDGMDKLPMTTAIEQLVSTGSFHGAKTQSYGTAKDQAHLRLDMHSLHQVKKLISFVSRH